MTTPTLDEKVTIWEAMSRSDDPSTQETFKSCTYMMLSVIRELKAERDALKKERDARKWRTIETAPTQEGVKVLIYTPTSGSAVAMLDEGDWIGGLIHYFPTHWMPLPRVPNT